MKTALQLITLVLFLIVLYLYWGEETIAHLCFPSVPDDVPLSPSQPQFELQFEQSLLLLFSIIAASIILFIIFKNRVLPSISAGLLNWLTGNNSSYSPEDDELVQILNQLGPSPQREDLALLDAHCQRQPKRLRNWMEYAHLLRHHFRDHEAAIELLLRAYKQVAEDEDKALILYRIAGIYEQELKQKEQASHYYSETARLYPYCSYGKLATNKH